MAIVKKALKGIGKALTTENKVFNADGWHGGLSALLVPRQVNGAGAALIIGGGAALSLGSAGLQSRNKAKLGRVSYSDGMSRMTNSFTTGAVPAMKRASGGNYAAFADMAEEVVASPGIGGMIDDYGASPAFISALYNMGGR